MSGLYSQPPSSRYVEVCTPGHSWQRLTGKRNRNRENRSSHAFNILGSALVHITTIGIPFLLPDYCAYIDRFTAHVIVSQYPSLALMAGLPAADHPPTDIDYGTLWQNTVSGFCHCMMCLH